MCVCLYVCVCVCVSVRVCLCVCVMECCMHIDTHDRGNQLLETIWMKLEDILLNTTIQAQNDKCEHIYIS